MKSEDRKGLIKKKEKKSAMWKKNCPLNIVLRAFHMWAHTYTQHSSRYIKQTATVTR